MSLHEAKAFLAALEEVAPSSPTASAGWTAHDIVAHLAAGSKEAADLIEEELGGQPPRPTRSFSEREPPFRALPDGELRAALVTQFRRKAEAVDALAELGEDATFGFTGTTMTAAQSSTHGRSETALHRWDMVGDDDVSTELLGRPELTCHAVAVLNAMPILAESPGARVARAGGRPLRIVLRATSQPDIVLAAESAAPASFDILDHAAADGDALVVSDPAHRLLIIWGRRSSRRPVTIDTDPASSQLVSSILWPAAVPW
jgi:uncharacterized protein (TIGR03083 family)